MEVFRTAVDALQTQAAGQAAAACLVVWIFVRMVRYAGRRINRRLDFRMYHEPPPKFRPGHRNFGKGRPRP